MKKILAVLLLCLTVFSLNACQSETKETSGSIQTNTNGENAYADPLGRYEEPVTIKVIREKRSIWFPEGEDIYNNVITDFYEEKLNVKFEVIAAAEAGQLGSLINLAIASNELPDIFEVTAAQLYNTVKAGQVQSLQTVWDTYASDSCKEILGEYNNGLFFSKGVFDGEIYGYPCTDDFASAIPILFIRQDWLDKLNLDPPTTLDKLMEVCEAFTNGDPDGDNKNDTFAIAMDNTASFSMNARAIAHGLGLYNDMWLENDEGELYYTDVQPEHKEVLKVLQDMYAKGYIDKDYVTKDTSRMAYEIAAGNCGMFYGYFWTALYQPQMNIMNEPDAKWMCYPMPELPTGGYRSPIDNSCYRWLVCRAGYEHPEALIKIQNLWYELWRGEYSSWYHGLNSTDYSQAQEDFKYYPPFWWDPPLKNYNIAVNLRKTLDNNGDTSYIKDDYEAMKSYTVIKDWLDGNKKQYYGWSHWLNNVYAWNVIEDYYGGTDSSKYVMSRYQGPLVDTVARIQPLLDSLRTEAFDKIIQGADIDSSFEKFVKEWYAIGGEKLYKIYNEWYKENKDRYWPVTK